MHKINSKVMIFAPNFVEFGQFIQRQLQQPLIQINTNLNGFFLLKKKCEVKQQKGFRVFGEWLGRNNNDRNPIRDR